MKNTQDSETKQNLQDDLEPDVAKVFKNSEDVNKALRAILSAIPEK